MRLQYKSLGLLAAMTLTLAGTMSLVGCGSATSNDQGVSFTLLGFFTEAPDAAADCKTLPTGVLGLYMPLNDPSSEVSPAAGDQLVYLGMQNNLSQQFIRTDRVFIEYYVPGASTQPPSTSLPFSAMINPSVSSSTDGTSGGTTAAKAFESSLPPSFGGGSCSRSYGGFTVVPEDVRSWMNFNRGELPEPPFVMTAIVSLTGITSAGDRLTSNEASIDIHVTPDVVIPAEGTDGSASADATPEPTAAP